ncbi:hypothetical protein ACHAWF_002791, partial [Thalassiosira exigua]
MDVPAEDSLRRRRGDGGGDNGDRGSGDDPAVDVPRPPAGDDSARSLLREYAAACVLYGRTNRLDAGVCAALRYRLPSLRVSGSGFEDADALALAEVLLRHCNGKLAHVRRLDFSSAAKGRRRGGGGGRDGGGGGGGMRSHGAYALSKVLRISRRIDEVFLPGNRVGPYGASAIFEAARSNPTLWTLLMRGCRIGERGAFAFASRVLTAEDEEEDEKGDDGGGEGKWDCGLREVDLSVNRIGFYGVLAVEKAMKRRTEVFEERRRRGKEEDIRSVVDLEGNMVFQEVMNCVTHGLGIFLALLGTFLLSREVRGKPRHYVLSCAIFSASLVVLYLSSTLYHSFFALQRTRYVFQVFDMSAIYVLIAGSYTPFLSVALRHEARRSNALLAFIWTCGLSGIGVEALMPLWKHKPKFSLAMYLGMGWSCLICMGDLVAALPRNALCFLVAGGVAYTSGVPFF